MGRQDLGKADIPSNTGTHVGETMNNKKERQDVAKADTPSNKGNQEGAPWETKGKANKGKQERLQWETKGNKSLGKADIPSNKGK